MYQETHIRFPLGPKLTEPEQYLVFLLIRDFQSNPDRRFEIIPSKEVNDFLQAAQPGLSAVQILLFLHRQTYDCIFCTSSSKVSLNPQLLRYVIAIVDEKSLTKAS